MAAFIFLFPPFIFPAGFRSYDWVSHIGVISGSQTCLSAGADNCTGLSTKQKARGGRQREGGRPLIYSHLLQSFLIDLACLHQQSDPGVAFSLYLTLQLRPLVQTQREHMPSVCQSKQPKQDQTRPRTQLWEHVYTLYKMFFGFFLIRELQITCLSFRRLKIC